MKKAIITGGNRGIGRAIAKRFAQDGYQISFSYGSSEETAIQTAKEIEEITGMPCPYYKADFSKSGEAEQFIDKAVNALGGVDVLVNNAAITRTHREIFDLSADFVERLIQANLSSPIMCMQRAAVHMATNKVQGCIINISSVRGMDHVAFPHDAIYAASKAGIDRAIQSFALSLGAYGIRINNVAPGATRNKTREESLADGVDVADIDHAEAFATQKIPLARNAMPEDIAAVTAFLASDEASYITGITIPVDGGLTLPGMPERRPKPGEEDKGWGYVSPRAEFQ